MTWTFEEISREWLGGNRLSLDAGDVERAFDMAEAIRGREWVLGNEILADTSNFPGIGRRGGFCQFERVYWFGKRIQVITGLPGSERLVEKLKANHPSAESELTALYLLRSRRPDTEAEIAPEIITGSRRRQPDFRIRRSEDGWTYVEVTQLSRSSMPSIRMQQLLQRIADRVASISLPFLLEIAFWREPTEAEEREVLEQATIASRFAEGYRVEVSDVAVVLVKSGNPAIVSPAVLQEDDRPRMALSTFVGGTAERSRQITVRIPFEDQRAEAVLSAEARQLPRHQCGLVMADVTAQQSAFTSWAELIPPRFTRHQHTRVAGVILFSFVMYPTAEGLAWLPSIRLISNPLAYAPLPNWITEVVAETRAENRRITQRPD
jgi:hypothetical protein